VVLIEAQEMPGGAARREKGEGKREGGGNREGGRDGAKLPRTFAVWKMTTQI